MKVMKIIKLLLAVTILIGIMFSVFWLISDLGFVLIKTTRCVLPPSLWGCAGIICMYLVPVMSVGIVAFIGGAVCYINPNTMRLAGIAYTVLFWLIDVKLYLCKVSEVPESFSSLVLPIMSVCSVITFLFVLIFSKWMCLNGRKLRENIRKYRVVNR